MEADKITQKVPMAQAPVENEPFHESLLNQKGSFLLILGAVVIIFVVIGAGGYLLTMDRDSNFNQNTSQPIPTSSLTPTVTSQTSTSFQNLLVKNCLNQSADKSLSGEIILDTLPLTIKLDDLKSNKGSCDSYFSKYVNVTLGEENSFMTISDKNSNHCCHGPSSLIPAGKLVKSQGDINIYIHTGTWGAGPNSGYKPIIARGVKKFQLSNGEEIRVVLDRKALDKSDINLQKIEDKYQIIDPNFDSGAKVLTPETVDKMFMDSFFSNFSDSLVVKKVESDLQSVSIKN